MAHPVYLTGYIDRLGTGTNDLIDACVAKGLKTPEFIQDEDFCTIIWRKNASGWQEPDKENDKESRRQLTVNENIVISFIRSYDKENDKEKLTTAYIAKQIGLSYPTVQRIIAKLKSLGLVHRIGGDKGGYWSGSEE